MKRTTIGLALGLTLAFGLVPGTAWAWGPHAFHGGHHPRIRHHHGGFFTGHRHPLMHHKFRTHHHPHFTHHRSNHHRTGPHHAGEPVSIPSFWRWNGFGWVWVPGRSGR